MNPVVLVTSCYRDVHNGNEQVQRETCFANSYIPYKFILGGGNIKRNEDELIFDEVPDDYHNCSWKTREGCRWALENGYDYIFKCDIDTYLFTDRLLKSGFEKRDYVGRFVDDLAQNWLISANQHEIINLNGNHVRASGFAYGLSVKAAEVLIKEEPRINSPEWQYEDWHTGMVLAKTGIRGTYDYRYHPGPYDECAKLSYKKIQPYLNDLCAIHLGQATGIYNKSRMYAIHNGKQVYEL